MRMAIIGAMMVLLAGCAIQMQPQSKAGTLFRTPVAGATAQLVVSSDFQQLTLRQKPSFGKSWGPRTFEIAAGQALTQSLVSQMKSIVPSVRIGDRDDGAPSAVTLVPQDVALEFGVDDGKAVNAIALGGVFGAGSKAEVRAEATLASNIIDSRGGSRMVVVTGKSARHQALISVTQSVMADVIGDALGDAAAQLVAAAETELRNSAPQ